MRVLGKRPKRVCGWKRERGGVGESERDNMFLYNYVCIYYVIYLNFDLWYHIGVSTAFMPKSGIYIYIIRMAER